MLLRYLYLLRSSWPRTLELLYWPTLQMLIWGFMSQFLRTNSSYIAKAFGVLLGAVMLWDALFRSQLGLSISFLEEMWARNLGQLFVTPLRPYEWVLSLLAMSVIRVTIGVVPATLLAIPLYHYSIFAMGLPLVAFFVALLIMGWALGLAICGLILRQGMGAAAISALAGARLFVALGADPTLAPVRNVIFAATVLFWSLASWWIPLLVALALWRYRSLGIRSVYSPENWSIVFPLGMYTTATWRLSHDLGLRFLQPVPEVFVWVALAAWVLTSAGMVRRAFGGPHGAETVS